VPSFTAALPNLHAAGPVVDMRIAVGVAAEAALRRARAPVPSPVAVLAMIDTGATNTVIRQGLAQQLGLHPVGVTYINTPSSSNVACYEYLVRLVFPNNVVGETTAIEAPLRDQHIQCLIGREVLAHGVFVYIGYSNLFSLSF
jgi:predicted aspartyl protease